MKIQDLLSEHTVPPAPCSISRSLVTSATRCGQTSILGRGLDPRTAGALRSLTSYNRLVTTEIPRFTERFVTKAYLMSRSWRGIGSSLRHFGVRNVSIADFPGD
jgi:hypothetical protein